MSTQPAQTRSDRETITLTLTLKDLYLLLDALHSLSLINTSSLSDLYLRLIDSSISGGACLPPVMPSGAELSCDNAVKQGQGGTNSCNKGLLRECVNCSFLCFGFCTHEALGKGGNQ
jgi:hypothetical protein